MDYPMTLSYAVEQFFHTQVPTGAVIWDNGWVVALVLVLLLLLSLAGIAYSALPANNERSARSAVGRPVVWVESRLRVRAVYDPRRSMQQASRKLRLPRLHPPVVHARRNLH